MKHVYCVIMAGGVGSRFWPVSTSRKPKQFLDILNIGETLLQQTFRRLSAISGPENIFVITNTQYADITRDQLPSLGEDRLILEPARRNTAPCIAYATFKLKKMDPMANILVSPADHLITDDREFERVAKASLECTRNNNVLLTLGIEPRKPETGYGYIQYKEPEREIHPEVKQVKTFTEKPELYMAESFLESGDFLWNSGIFVWNANAIMNAFEKHLPDIYQAFEQGWEKLNTEEERAYIDEVYPSMENESVDYGLLEKANNVFVFPAGFGWSDLGTWSTVYEQSKSDENGNSGVGQKVLLYNARNNIIHIGQDKVAVIDGLEDYTIISEENRLLIFPRSKEQAIRMVVNDVRMEFGEQYV